MTKQASELVQSMPQAFLPEKAGNAKAAIQLDLRGDGGGVWVLDIADGVCQVQPPSGTKPDVTVTMDADDFVALYHNRLNPVQAFMSGKIKVSGNVGMVMQMLNWFER
ncbi:MAG: SCP2 sterol-binding domain-containing protein [Anaerolineae bacterium]|nr:SCP2 sterol-binding domain-containing protein [Anaerolineae bacterium]